MYDNRFTRMSLEGSKIGRSTFYVVRDRVTGVLYTYIEAETFDGGISLSPILGEDGKPLIDTEAKEIDDLFEKFGMWSNELISGYC